MASRTHSSLSSSSRQKDKGKEKPPQFASGCFVIPVGKDMLDHYREWHAREPCQDVDELETLVQFLRHQYTQFRDASEPDFMYLPNGRRSYDCTNPQKYSHLALDQDCDIRNVNFGGAVIHGEPHSLRALAGFTFAHTSDVQYSYWDPLRCSSQILEHDMCTMSVSADSNFTDPLRELGSPGSHMPLHSSESDALEHASLRSAGGRRNGSWVQVSKMLRGVWRRQKSGSSSASSESPQAVEQDLRVEDCSPDV